MDFLSASDYVDPDRIGIIGICGWGGMALNAAAIDTRIKATLTSTMYNMSRVNANGYFDSADNEEARYQLKKELNAQRTEDYKKGFYVRGGGTVDPDAENVPEFVHQYAVYYRGKRGYHPRSLNSTDGWNRIGCMSFINQPICCYTNEIRSAVLMIHGEKAHSLYFSQDEYKKMTDGSKYAGNKELMIIPGANHTDLYDGGDNHYIPWERIDQFFKENLK